MKPAARDLPRVKRLGAEYRAASGLPLVLTDREGRERWRLGGCMLCQRLARSPRLAASCREHRRRAVEESFRWGEPYISICPFGLVTFAVPLSRERRLSGGLISGFAIFPQMQADMR
jgi:ligand-binding sensor protein